MVLYVLPLAFGAWQIAIVAVVALIIFGGKGIGRKIAGIIKGTGEGVKEFKKALNEDDKGNEENEENEESKEGEE
jgi:sec-independent protein translocase protein TatA